jgi:SHS family lactate transporter-like MFS transporter
MTDMALGAIQRTRAGAWGWGVMALCLAVWTLANLDQSLFSYALPGILATFHLPLEAAGIVLAISFGCASALVVGAGLFADRYGRGLSLFLLLGASAVFVGMQGFAAGVVTLTLARAVGFSLSGGLSPITSALAAETAPDRLRGIVGGVLQCGYPLGWLLASLVAAPLLRDFGWRAACFAAFAVVPAAVLGGLVFTRRIDGAAQTHSTAHITKPRPRLRRLFEPALRRRSVACFATYFLFGGAYSGSAFFFPTFFNQVRGYSPADAATLVGLSNGIAVIGYLAAAIAGEYWLRRRTVFALWLIGGAVALCGLLWFSGTRASDLCWFSAMAALFYGAMAVMPVLMAEIFDAEIRATALAACASAPLSLGFAVFPLIVPLVVGWIGWREGLSLITIPLLLIAAVSALALPNRPSGLPVDEPA